MGLSSSHLPKLEGNNFQSWREMVEMAMELKGIKRALETAEVDHRMNIQAKLFLLETMSEEHRCQVRSLTTAKDMMNRLEKIYADNSASNLFRLLHEYFRYTKPANEPISVHVGKFSAMRAALADIGEEQSEELFQVALLAALPPEYGNLLELWEISHPDTRTTSNLVGRMLKREDDLKKTGDRALVARGKQMTLEERKKVTRCNACHKIGHWARECPEANKTKGELTRSSRDTRTEYNSLVRDEVSFDIRSLGREGLNLKNKWIVDSGATSHMASNQEMFSELTLYPSPRNCAAGDGYRMKVLGTGKVRLTSQVGKEIFKIVLNDVLLIPELEANLISVGAATDQGIETVFDRNHCHMSKDKVKMIEGIRLEDRL